MSEPDRSFDSLHRLPPARRWREQKRPVASVIALIQRPQGQGQDAFLLIRRRKAPYAGYWALVGGKMEFGETLAVAAVREVAEETGLVAAFDCLRGVVNERLAPAGPDGRAGHFLIFVCAVAAPEGQPQEQREGALRWFTRAEIDDLHAGAQIIPSDYAMIRRFGDSGQKVPYYEVEMIAAGPAVSPSLQRFERID